VPIGRKLGRPFCAAGEGGKFAGDFDGSGVKRFRMDLAAVGGEMRQQRLVAQI